jgi:arylsulfatase A-like enzyme
MGEHGLNMKLAPYNASLASPLIVSQPGVIPQGKICRHAVNSADLVVTFFKAAGIAPPWKLHGRDLGPLLREPARADWDHPTLMTFTGARYGSDTKQIPTGKDAEYNGVPWWVMLRDGQYKYVRYLIAGETEEIYDLRADPEELRNLAGEASWQPLLKRLREKAIAELRRTEAGFADAMPATASMVRE